MKKKRKRFSASKEVRAIARERIGAPPAEKVLPNARLKPEKHRKRLTADD
jgi:hypothetical protein